MRALGLAIALLPGLLGGRPRAEPSVTAVVAPGRRCRAFIAQAERTHGTLPPG